MGPFIIFPMGCLLSDFVSSAIVATPLGDVSSRNQMSFQTLALF